MAAAYRAFEPRPKVTRSSTGEVSYTVDCRPWPRIMATLNEPMRRQFISRTEAVRWCRELIIAEATGTKRAHHWATVHDYCESYLKSCDIRLRASTARNYSATLKNWREWCKSHGAVYVDHVTPSIIEQYHGDLIAAGFKPSTVSSYIRVISASFSWGVKMRLLSENPCIGMVPTAPKSNKRALTDEERHTIVTKTDPELRDIWIAYLLTGLRRSELAALPIADIHLDSPTPHLVVTGKGGKPRTVWIAGPGIDLFRELIAAAHTRGSDKISPYASGTLAIKWQRERERLGLASDISIHTFRHDAATHWANSGTQLNEVRDLLGHTSVTVTEIYLHPNRAAARECVAQRSAQLLTSAPSVKEASVPIKRVNDDGPKR